MAGNGAGIKDRRHITEATSPRPREREASVFRLDPDGKRWECLASGGRNPPSLAMHSTGELFSFDSDMEWHVGLPWYKPVRLNHWAIGSDQGWQEVGAYPSYFIDCVPHVVAVGRGSPNWGVFYEHTQFPGRYRHAFVVCDYPWKGSRTAATPRPGGSWFFSSNAMAPAGRQRTRRCRRSRPRCARTGRSIRARGCRGRARRQPVPLRPQSGVLAHRSTEAMAAGLPPLCPEPEALPSAAAPLIDELLALPQPAAERSREARPGDPVAASAPPDDPPLRRRPWTQPAPSRGASALSASSRPMRASLDVKLLAALSKDAAAEVRGQAAWLINLRGKDAETDLLARLLMIPTPS